VRGALPGPITQFSPQKTPDEEKSFEPKNIVPEVSSQKLNFFIQNNIL